MNQKHGADMKKSEQVRFRVTLASEALIVAVMQTRKGTKKADALMDAISLIAPYAKRPASTMIPTALRGMAGGRR